ncbi:MAG TPA: redoxin domain-containing protein [Terriglobales bacterium]|jgi:peroxiredoxin|nr:redoxin domain-containing protein [Terriglobales bacterium]
MMELGEFTKHYREFQAANTEILAISTDPLEEARWIKEKVRTPFPVLSDVKRVVMTLYGTKFLTTYQSPDGGPYNHATLILVDKDGVIRWIYRNEDYRIRASVADDLQHIKELR